VPAKPRFLIALLICLFVLAAVRANAGETIFTANPFYVAAYPVGSSDNFASSVPPTGMIDPGGVARDSSGRIYVTNGATNTVTIYAASADGNVAPLAVIGGANTQLADPSGIALDGSGKIYVLNGNGEGRITEYPPIGASTGILDGTPSVTIGGNNTLLDQPDGIAVNVAGDIYTVNRIGGPIVSGESYDRGSVTVYATGSNGNVAPAVTIDGAATGLSFPDAIALDAEGNIYVVNAETANTGSTLSTIPSITVYQAGSDGNATPKAIIAGSKTGLIAPEGIAIDASGYLYVADFGGSLSTIGIFLAGSNGNVAPGTTIAGANTGLARPIGLVLDAAGNIYVANTWGGPFDVGSVTVYAAGSSGNSSPTATIISNIPQLDEAAGIALDADGNIYVANENNSASPKGSITIYPPGSYATTAPAATIAGTHTGLDSPLGIAADAAGDISVLNSNNAVTEYPAGSAGDAVPSVTLNLDTGGAFVPTAIATGPSDDLYVVNQRQVCTRRLCSAIRPGKVTIFRAGSAGEAKPRAVIEGDRTRLAFPSSIAVDRSGEIYVANQGPGKCVPGCGCIPVGPGSVTIYAPGSRGDAKPIARIGGSNTGLGRPDGIALDANGNVYVLNNPEIVELSGGGRGSCLEGFFFNSTLGAILTFSAGSDGNVAPIATIGNLLTPFDYPSAIAIGPGTP
jgi:sugar lactone lactonase YvrE